MHGRFRYHRADRPFSAFAHLAGYAALSNTSSSSVVYAPKTEVLSAHVSEDIFKRID
jgi:hypothetical protein